MGSPGCNRIFSGVTNIPFQPVSHLIDRFYRRILSRKFLSRFLVIPRIEAEDNKTRNNSYPNPSVSFISRVYVHFPPTLVRNKEGRKATLADRQNHKNVESRFFGDLFIELKPPLTRGWGRVVETIHHRVFTY